MRCYYLFKINPSFSNLYYNKSYYLYKTLEDISKENKNNFMVTYNLYSQIVEGNDKYYMNNIIYNAFCFDRNYKRILNKHTYDNGVEKTRLTIYNSYIKIKSNKNITNFFKPLRKEENIFVCDFENRDYFWLNKSLSKILAYSNYF